MIRQFITVTLLMLLIVCYSQGSTKTYSPNLNVVVESIYDGDTFNVTIPDIHPVFGEKIGVRIRGIDSPEIKSKNKLEKLSALKSKEFAANTLLNQKVELRNLGRDKYFRLLSDVFIDGHDFGQMMIDKGLAKPYNGKKKEKF